MSNKYKILIIEDEANIRNFVKILLVTNQYQVFTAENGAEGLFELRVHCPDLILLDLGLPDQDARKKSVYMGCAGDKNAK